MKKLILSTGAAILVSAVFAQVKLATPFADGMVLQRDCDVAVWGTADANESVSVTFGGVTRQTVAKDGKWMVKLPPMKASKESRELKVNDIVLKDVLVGEVWFCSGQSNTEMPLVGGSPHFSDRIGRLVAQMTEKPYVRFVYASNYKFSLEPKREAAYKVVWKKATRDNLMNAPSFSAMGMYFALELYSALDIPIGIVGSYWGGTNIDAWTPASGYDGKAELQDVANRKKIPANEWTDQCKQGPVCAAHQQTSVLYNEMVAPWTPMAMRGFIWYQGCHNSGESQRYGSKMHALYDGWAKEFANPNLKLYFVQIAPFSHSWWGLHEQQAKFAAEEKNAKMVVTADIGNNHDIHPWEKETIGKRLAILALKYDYGFDKLVADSPTVSSAITVGDAIELKFNDAKGLYAYDPAWDIDYGFEVQGEDQNGPWKKAFVVNANDGATNAAPWKTRGEIKGDKLVVKADGVKSPRKVRYLYQRPWIGKIYSKDSGLPVGPFEAEVTKVVAEPQSAQSPGK